MPHTPITQVSSLSIIGWRIYGGSVDDVALSPGPQDGAGLLAGATGGSFNTVSLPWEALTDKTALHVGRSCRDAGLRLMLDIRLGETDDGALHERLQALRDDGVTLAVLLRQMASLGEPEARQRFNSLREQHDDVSITVWTPGMTPTQLHSLQDQGVDGVYSSLPWWDYREDWFIEEYERLRAVAPVITPLADPRTTAEVQPDEVFRRWAVAGLAGEAWLIPGRQARQLGKEGLALTVEHAEPMGQQGSGLRRLSGSLSDVTLLFRRDDGRRLLLLNPHAGRSASIERGLIERRLPNGFVLERSALAGVEHFELPPAGCLWLPLAVADWVAKYGLSSRQQRSSLSQAMRHSRIAIEAVQPVVEDGRFAVKRSLGATVVVRANIFTDGHEELAAQLLWRASNEQEWQAIPMQALGNDAWEARFMPSKLGRHVFTVAAWLDRWRSYAVQLEKKRAAGVDVSLEVEEGRGLLQAALDRATEGEDAATEVVQQALGAIGAPMPDSSLKKLRARSRGGRQAQAEAQPLAAIPLAGPEQVNALLSADLAAAMAQLDERAFETQAGVEYPLSIERTEALFSSWYEMFPRSQSPIPGQHGTLRDVISRLPDIRRMGFDVLYFPPIHPIGSRNRKGRNNSLQAGPDDPGSPYAIGSEDGGHDALHPELGTLNDFRDLVAAARQQGLEIALDFAIQCSPDHPWLREHPEWFNWRPDGTLKHAENPPKRYEDIVNPDFYSPLASTPRQAALWRALRDSVLFWVQQGVRIFRVDNPHTKPLPFWEWMLREVRDRHPDTLFLSEAFTRPAMMYRLAKLGFSQSYTYFTWRNTKQELTDYLIELNQPPVRDFFRPNFFVNTPDINPWFLQNSGKAGFLIRALLATTLSGSWGMYNGFELCVADAVPGKEEYLDSEKYQLRRWDMNSPGHIIEEITRLNRIRRSHPALQSHLGVQFHTVNNDHLLFYSRHSVEGDSVVLVVVSLDPHGRQAGTLELPLDDWGLAEHQALPLHDLFEDRRFELRGRRHHIELSPERPFVIWARVTGREA